MAGQDQRQSSSLIRTATRLCFLRFDRWLVADALVPQEKSAIVAQRDRLQVWASNIGVFAPHFTASADYRLRKDTELREAVFALLTRVGQDLKDRAESSRSLLIQRNQVQLAATASRSDGAIRNSSQSSASSLELSSESEMEELQGSGRERSLVYTPAPGLEPIRNTITRLFRLTKLIRNPVQSTDHAQVLAFTNKHSEVTAGDADLASHVEFIIKQHHSKVIPSYLLSRLVAAALFRHHRFEYRKKHKLKLQGDIEAYLTGDSEIDSSLDISLELDETTPSPESKASANSPGNEQTLKEYTFSATVPSWDGERRNYFSPSSKDSSTQSAGLRLGKLDLPNPPKIVEGAQEAVCPYCFVPLDQNELMKRRWR